MIRLPAAASLAGPQFASDNNAGICPEALAALVEANKAGHAAGYGDDPWTDAAKARLRAILEAPSAEIFFVFNGTAANALALAAYCQPYHAVLCHTLSHVDTDESGAPEFFTGGAKLLPADAPDAKLTPAHVERLATRYQGFHHVKARALSLTQSTEAGTIYEIAALQALTATARKHGLKVHMDGARFANAVAHLGCAPADISWRAGVDVLCFGGTKNGLGIGEAIVFFNPADATDFAWRVKQSGQLASKMRLVTAPWLGLLEGDVWLRNARHSNAMATRLATGIAGCPGVKLLFPVQANAVFADIPVTGQAALRAKGWKFYTFLGETGCRLMCAWDTTPEVIDQFALDLRSAV